MESGIFNDSHNTTIGYNWITMHEIVHGKECSQLVAETDDAENAGSIIVFKRNKTAHIGYFGVKPKYRNQGYGHELFAQAVEWARAGGTNILTGNLIPVAGCETSLLRILQKFNAQIDFKKGEFSVMLDSLE